MNGSELIELTYMSKSTIAPDEQGGTEALLERIAESSVEVNLPLDVTGVLLVGKRCFAQILEGSASAVDEIFEQRVLPATSHTDVLLLSRNRIRGRSFREWSMAFVHDQSGILDRFVAHRAWEIETASSLSESPAHWPLDLLLEDISRIVGHIATTSVEKMRMDRAGPARLCSG